MIGRTTITSTLSHSIKQTKTSAASGAALIEFAVVAIILLGVLLPGVVSIGKAISEVTAASQSVYLGTRLGAEEKIDLASDSPEAHVRSVRDRIATVVHGRVVQTMEPMSKTEGAPETEVTLYNRPEDTNHWLISTDIQAEFPLVFASFPIRVRAVSSALNLQPETTQDLTTPQRLRLAGQTTYTSYSCLPQRCTNGAGCNPACCVGDSVGLGLRFCDGTVKFGGGEIDPDIDIFDPGNGDLPDGGG